MRSRRRSSRLGREAIRERREIARQLLKEHGVTYNVHADGQSAERPWNLDILPLVLGAERMGRLAPASCSARGCSISCCAISTARSASLRDGLLPPALVHANPGFLRCCHGIRPPAAIFSPCTRSISPARRMADGGCSATARRRRAASATRWRIASIISRVLPDEFREFARRSALGDVLRAPQGRPAFARAVDERADISSCSRRGRYTETYFEHAYLARHLGYPVRRGQRSHRPRPAASS